jgi:hypothetical protein
MAGFAGLGPGGGLLAESLALHHPVGTDRDSSLSQTGARTVEVCGGNHAPIVTGDNNTVHVQDPADVHRVDLRGTKGAQIGDDNTQVNHW